MFRNTNQHEGWREVFSPGGGCMRYLSYARLVLGSKVPSHVVRPDDREWALLCLSPTATVDVNGAHFEMATRDLLYVPRRCEVRITGKPGTDIAFGGCPAHVDSEPQLVRYNAIKDDPDFVIDVGSRQLGTERRIYNMLGDNVKASRLLAGFTVGMPGAWTSWPPHEHDDSKEEFYLFFDMPKPAFSVQFVYSSFPAMECCEPVGDSDCVAIPHGYHPTAAAPGVSSCFLWCMAAFDPDKHRSLKYGVNIQPDYKDIKFF